MKINKTKLKLPFRQPVQLKHLCLFILFLLQTTLVSAALCTTSTGAGALGTQNSIQAASALTTTGTAGMSCNAFQLSILSGAVFTGTLTGSTYGLKLTNPSSISGNTISYQVYSDVARTRVFTQNTPMNYLQGGLLGLIFVGGGAASVPLYVQTTAGANVEAGVYKDTLTFNWSYTLCTGLGVGGACILGGWETSSGTSQVEISMTVTNICLATAPDVALGSHALIDQFTSISQNATARCTLNANYQAYFENGNNYTAPWRRMANGTNYMQYNIYYPSTTTPWTAGNPLAKTGTGAIQNIPYDAAVNPLQITPVAGSYTDKVVFVIAY